MYSYCMFMYLHRASWHSSATLTEVFPWLFLSCKTNARVKPRKDGARPALFQNCCVVLCTVCFVSLCVLFVCKCVLYFCHRVTTQLQLTNITIRSFSFFLGVRRTPTVSEDVAFHNSSSVPHKFCYHNQQKHSSEVGVEILAPRCIIFGLRYTKKYIYTLPPRCQSVWYSKVCVARQTSRSHLCDTVILWYVHNLASLCPHWSALIILPYSLGRWQSYEEPRYAASILLFLWHFNNFTWTLMYI